MAIQLLSCYSNKKSFAIKDGNLVTLCSSGFTTALQVLPPFTSRGQYAHSKVNTSLTHQLLQAGPGVRCRTEFKHWEVEQSSIEPKPVFNAMQNNLETTELKSMYKQRALLQNRSLVYVSTIILKPWSRVWRNNS
eukprot:3789415-Amphidinium_carterae.1